MCDEKLHVRQREFIVRKIEEDILECLLLIYLIIVVIINL